MSNAHLTTQSKRLAYLLRHSTLPNQQGWMEVKLLLSEHNFTENELTEIVNTDTKGRFEFSEDGALIRALYGHSNGVSIEYQKLTPPAILYHGTAKKYLSKILTEGLKPQSRNFVHLSENHDMARNVGERHGEPIILHIETAKILQNGGIFYKAQNGIWLTKFIAPEHITAETELK